MWEVVEKLVRSKPFSVAFVLRPKYADVSDFNKMSGEGPVEGRRGSHNCGRVIFEIEQG